MRRLFVMALSLLFPCAALGYHALLVTDPDDQADALHDFLTGLGYTVTVARDYPDASGMADYDFVVCRKGSLEGMAPTFEAYLDVGGGVFIWSGQPKYLGMPAWLGMSFYDNWFGSYARMQAARDNPLDAPGVLEGDAFYRRVYYWDGGAVLRNPTTAVVDGRYYNDTGAASQIHNEYGPGRVAWSATWLHPWDEGEYGYTTEEYESYLEAVYAWLCGSHIGVEKTTWGRLKALE